MAFDKNHTSTAQKVVIIFFAVVLVVSMCLPFFSSCSFTKQETGAAPADQAQEAAEEVVTTTASSSVSSVRAKYSSVIKNLEKKLEANPENTTAMASLGNNYMDMASEITSAPDYGDNADAAVEAYNKAVEYYDMYLERNDSPAVRVDRDICLFYGDRADEAIADLEKYCEGPGSDYPMAWYNLGIMHYSNGDYQFSVEAFQKAIDLDSDGAMGVASNASLYQAFAQSMIDAEAEALAAAEEGAAEEEADSEEAQPAAEDAEPAAEEAEPAADPAKK